MSKPRHYAESGEDPYCNYAMEHIRTDIYAKQLKDAKAETSRLRGELQAAGAQLGVLPRELDGELEQILVDLANAFHTGELFGHAAPGAQAADETKTGRQKPHSAAPRGGDPHARSALYQLAKKVRNALDVFESRQLNEWKPPQEQIDFDPPGVRDRCWTRGCAFRARRFVDECPGCGKKAGTTSGTTHGELSASVDEESAA